MVPSFEKLEINYLYQYTAKHKIQPCNSRNFYCFPLDPHLSHQSLDKDHCNFPVGKAKIIIRENGKGKNYSGNKR